MTVTMDPETPVPGPGSTALVTGATSGIGLEVARQLLGRGLTVHVAGRRRERLEQAMQELAGLGDARPVELEVTDEDAVRRLAERVDTLDVLVNNAGTNPGAENPLVADLSQFRRAYETNVLAVVAVDRGPPAGRSSARRTPASSTSPAGGLAGLEHAGQPPVRLACGAGRGHGLPLLEDGAQRRHPPHGAGARGPRLAGQGQRPRARLRRTGLVPGMTRGGDPAEAAAGIVRLALLPDDGPTGGFFSYDGSPVPW